MPIRDNEAITAVMIKRLVTYKFVIGNTVTLFLYVTMYMYIPLHALPVIFDPCSSYASNECDFTISCMENAPYRDDLYTAYHGVLPRQDGEELRMKAQVTFAFSMMCNIQGHETLADQALNAGRDLLQTLKRL